MPSFVELDADAAAHLTKARHNFELYQKLRSERTHLDWAITLLFYTALHLVQSYACQHGPWVPRDHYERARFVNEELRPIYHPYRDLEDRSKNMRYDLHETTTAEVEAWHDVEFQRIAAHLGTNRRGIRLHPRGEEPDPTAGGAGN